jgi:hypothetical protein
MADKRDPVKTQAYIDDALGRFLRIPGRVDRTYYAWAYLRGMRRLGDDQLCRDLNIKVKPVDTAPSDLDLADAEHYMYARFLAGSTGDPATKSLVYGYELVKVVRYLTGREKDLRTDPRFPVLPPSAEAVAWGAQGAEDGMQDYRDTHGGKTGKMGTAIEANKSFANGQYKNAYIPQRVYPMTGT